MAKITTPFGFQSSTTDVIEGVYLGGRRALVTGGASGIGVETARALAQAGAAVTIAVRDLAAGEKCASEIIASTGNPDVNAMRLDLADQASIAEFTRSWDGPLHLLVANAGVMMNPEQRTPEGWELQFATNYLGHFALALRLHNALTVNARERGARIVVVSSSGHLFSPVVFDDIQFVFRPYDPLQAYGQSKTAAVLFAKGVTDRWATEGITANALNPGAIPTNLQRHVGGRLVTPVDRQKTTQQGAATSVLLATSPLVEGIGGRYFEDCNEADVVTHRNSDCKGVASYAIDSDNAARLWDISVRLLHL
jgi:NAD(P)-dependent dehydrogenase (short-subunit alcohol dehydrogenase family)